MKRYKVKERPYWATFKNVQPTLELYFSR